MQTYTAICKCILVPQIVWNRINSGFRRILARRVDVELMRDRESSTHSDEHCIGPHPTKLFRATSLKCLCLLAPQTFKCSSVANSDVELQIKMDLTSLLHTCLSSQPTRSYPRFWIRCSSFEHRRDLNPPESCAAQRTISLVHPPGAADRARIAPPGFSKSGV